MSNNKSISLPASSSWNVRYGECSSLILLTWRIWWAPKNASKWQMGFNAAFKGLINNFPLHVVGICIMISLPENRMGKGVWKICGYQWSRTRKPSMCKASQDNRHAGWWTVLEDAWIFMGWNSRKQTVNGLGENRYLRRATKPFGTREVMVQAQILPWHVFRCSFVTNWRPLNTNV